MCEHSAENRVVIWTWLGRSKWVKTEKTEGSTEWSNFLNRCIGGHPNWTYTYRMGKHCCVRFFHSLVHSFRSVFISFLLHVTFFQMNDEPILHHSVLSDLERKWHIYFVVNAHCKRYVFLYESPNIFAHTAAFKRHQAWNICSAQSSCGYVMCAVHRMTFIIMWIK